MDDEKKGDDIFTVSPEKFSQSTVDILQKNTDGDKEDDTQCGIGSWTPKWIQGAANTRLFLLFYSLAGLAQGASFTYLISCMSTLEKRYAYDTKKSGLIMIADEFPPILLGALIGYFGGFAHRPRLLAFGLFVGSLSSFVMAVPYFVYGAKTFDAVADYSVAKIPGVKAQFCDATYNGVTEQCGASVTGTVLSLFFLGNFLKGLSSCIFYTIGTPYMDDNVKKKNSPLYLATLFTLRLLGPTSGFLLSSLCLNYYEDPFHDPGYGPKDPRWIGAWWLGFIILGVAIFIFSLPMVLFPKRFPGKKIPDAIKKKKKEEEVHKSPIEQLKDMGKALKRLGKNPILTCHYLGGVFRLNGLVGYYVLLPKYMEMQFRQSASKASLYSGPAGLVGMMFGIMLGGVAIRKFKPRPRVMTGGIVFAETFSVIALIVCMLITCPIHQMTGTDSTVASNNFNLQNTCNTDCLCSTKVYTPVCGPDGKSTYFSPCHAGCAGYNKTGKKEVFTDCKCVHDEQGNITFGDADKGYCNSECQWLITFIVVLGLGKLVSSTARVGNALVTLRCVDPGDKSLALGALSGVFSLLAFIPYPLIYGALTDASCLVWEESCGKTGNCWVYDADKFRLLLHGVSAGFVFLGCLTDVAVCVLSPRIKNMYDEDVDEEVVHNGGMLGMVKTGMPKGSVNSLDEPTSGPL